VPPGAYNSVQSDLLTRNLLGLDYASTFVKDALSITKNNRTTQLSKWMRDFKYIFVEKKKKTNNIAMAFCLEQVLKLYVLERKNDLTTQYVFFFFFSGAKPKQK
jgi:hypothetical protein